MNRMTYRDLVLLIASLAVPLSGVAEGSGAGSYQRWLMSGCPFTPEENGNRVELINDRTSWVTGKKPLGWIGEFTDEKRFVNGGLYRDDNTNAQMSAAVNGPNGICYVLAGAEDGKQVQMNVIMFVERVAQVITSVNGTFFGASFPRIELNISNASRPVHPAGHPFRASYPRKNLESRSRSIGHAQKV